MTSFNHYALGAVADWVYKVIAGIQPAAPGYEQIRLAPTPGPGLDWAHGSLETRRGRVECGWRRTTDGYVIEVLVPDGLVAELALPDGRVEQVVSGHHSYVSGEREGPIR
jgi:alpha-L-rhamnosidase